MTRVVIIGAGPVGMTLAVLLASSGIRPVIIDKREALSNLPRGIAINQRSLAILEAAGVLQDVMAVGVKVNRLNLYAGNGLIGRVSFANPDLRHPYFFHVRQSEIEHILTQRLMTLGVEVLRAHTLSGLRQEPGGCLVDVLHQSGSTCFEADIVAGCDGGSSSCCSLSGIKVSRVAYGGFFQLADVELEDGVPSETDYVLTPQGYAMFIPAPRGETRVILSHRGRIREGAETPGIADFATMIAERTGRRLKIKRLIWATQAAFGHRVAERASIGRLFLAGDALHQFSPIGGTNMNVGLVDAQALADGIRSGGLPDYDSDRLALMRRQVEMTRYLTRIMVRPRGMKMPRRPFESRTLGELLTQELPGPLTGFATVEGRASQCGTAASKASGDLAVMTSSPSPFTGECR